MLRLQTLPRLFDEIQRRRDIVWRQADRRVGKSGVQEINEQRLDLLMQGLRVKIFDHANNRQVDRPGRADADLFAERIFPANLMQQRFVDENGQTVGGIVLRKISALTMRGSNPYAKPSPNFPVRNGSGSSPNTASQNTMP